MKKTKGKFYNKEEAYSILNRIDSWIRNCDTKFSILLALLGIFFGLTINIFNMFSKFINIISLWKETMLFDKILYIMGFGLVLSYISLIIMCTIFSIIGINAKVKNLNKNILFFGNIAQFKNYIEFENEINKLSKDEFLTLLNEQIYTNSEICTKKYKYYKKALFSLFPAIIISIFCLFILFI